MNKVVEAFLKVLLLMDPRDRREVCRILIERGDLRQWRSVWGAVPIPPLPDISHPIDIRDLLERLSRLGIVKMTSVTRPPLRSDTFSMLSPPWYDFGQECLEHKVIIEIPERRYMHPHF